MKYLLATLISSILLLGCVRPSQSSNGSVQAVHKYDGMTSQQVIATLGKPYYEDSFPLSSGLDEMRAPIQKYGSSRIRVGGFRAGGALCAIRAGSEWALRGSAKPLCEGV